MIQSHTRTITVDGEPAELSVIRNNGECWGRLVLPLGTLIDVEASADLYGMADEEALDALEVAAQDDQNCSPAQGWL